MTDLCPEGSVSGGIRVDYEVCIISDDDLPADVAWLFIRRGECLEFWLRESTTQRKDQLTTALREAWAAYRRIDADELFSWPALEKA